MIENKVTHYQAGKKPINKTWHIILWVITILVLVVMGLYIYHVVAKDNQITGFIFGQEIKGKDSGRTNILIMGMGGAGHPGGSLTDGIEVLSINWHTNQLAMLSIPRDLYVDIPDYGYSKINSAYAIGQEKNGNGSELTTETLSQILNIPIHYYVTVDFSAFVTIIDTIGGIDIDVEKTINDPYYPAEDMIAYDPFTITAGSHHLDGTIALKYARSRETTSDFDRAKRQQQIILAVKDKILSLETLSSPAKISTLLNTVSEHVKTNLTVSEITSLWQEISAIGTSNIISDNLENSEDGLLVNSTSKAGAYILIPRAGLGDYQDIQALEQNIFNTLTSSPTPTATKK